MRFKNASSRNISFYYNNRLVSLNSGDISDRHIKSAVAAKICSAYYGDLIILCEDEDEYKFFDNLANSQSFSYYMINKNEK
ncbi:MAG: hypothetical protein QXF12_06365 [Candidatus Aenigmatarchaeota archaeon]